MRYGLGCQVLAEGIVPWCSKGTNWFLGGKGSLPFRLWNSKAGYVVRFVAWLVKVKNPAAPAVTREAEEDWGK